MGNSGSSSSTSRVAVDTGFYTYSKVKILKLYRRGCDQRAASINYAVGTLVTEVYKTASARLYFASVIFLFYLLQAKKK